MQMLHLYLYNTFELIHLGNWFSSDNEFSDEKVVSFTKNENGMLTNTIDKIFKLNAK